MRSRRGVSAVAAAVLVTLALSGCGGGSPAGTSAGTTQVGVATTSAATPGQGTVTTSAASTTAPGTSPAPAADNGRPLARLAAACRSAPPPGTQGGQGNAGTHALAERVSRRVQLLTEALGGQRARSPLLEPLRHALAELRKAVRRASSAATPAARQALQQGVARLDAALQQIDVPECALAAG